MRQFSKADLEEISGALGAGKLLHQISCPNCYKSTIRWYQQVYIGPVRRVLLGYQWCPNCKSYLSSTGPVPSGYSKIDPIASNPATKAAIEGVHQIDELIDILDKLWDKGILP